jgi:DNA-binding MarR family transcriptional regulator
MIIDNSIGNKVCDSKFYSRSLTLLIPILRMIDQNTTLTDISKVLGIEKPHLSYYIRRSKELGYVKELVRDRIKILELTQVGKNVLDQYSQKEQIARSLACRAENIRLKAPVIRLPTKSPDWHKVEMSNWSQYTNEIDNIRVRINMGINPTIEFLPSPIDGDNPWGLFGILYHDCIEVARKVEQILDMEIGRLEMESGPEWVFYDPVANVLCKNNGQITIKGLGKINASKPSRKGAIEYFDIRRAAEYFAMPECLFRIEKMLEERLFRIEKMLEELSKHSSKERVTLE